MSDKTASIVAAIGATGSGKSAWIKHGLRSSPPARLLAWDPQGEYAEFGPVFTNRAKLLDHVERAGAGAFAAIYQPGDRASEYGARFDWFCRLAYALGELRMVVEELADVTEPSRAPDGWSVVTRKGRHKGLSIVAASQRPASVDKDFFGNCTFIHCGRLVYEADARCMANVLGVTAAELAQLKPLAYVERNTATGERRTGILQLQART